MGDKTLIAWCDRTWSPWFGCRKVSPGCDNCYIVTTSPFRVRGLKHGKRRDLASEAYWKLPARWNREAKRTGKTIRVFPSLCDPFDSEVPIAWLAQFVKVIMDTPHLTWLLLTKRPQLIQSRMLDAAGCLNLQWDGFPDNVWLGVSCENQEWADKRIPILLSIPAKVRFLSVEPMLGPVDLSRWIRWDHTKDDDGIKDSSVECEIDWAIFGGESGKGARPCHADWIRRGVRQCQEADVKAFVKQVGSCVHEFAEYAHCGLPGAWPRRRTTHASGDCMVRISLEHKKGGDPSEWPKDLRVQEVPTL